MGLNRLRTSPNTALNVGAINASNSTGTTGQYLESTEIATRWTSLNVSTLSSPTITGTLTVGGSTGTNGQYLQSTGSGAQWVTASSGATLSNDTTTNSTHYPTLSTATSGSYTTAVISSTKLTFNPFTGNFSATQFTSLSDITQKTNIRPIENPTELVKQLEGVRYDWINNNKPSIGVIAQDIEKVLPEVVETNSDDLKSVSYGNIVGVLIEAIKEQQIRIEELEKKLNA